MNSFFLAATSALWLGILTSISPCPLATNIAAVSLIGGKACNAKLALLSGILYTLGRVLAYTTLGLIAVMGVLSMPNLSFVLQDKMNNIIGPMLIITGIFLLELISINVPGFTFLETIQNRLKNMGLIGALLLGILFALSFCPVSAALFFGSLVPLAVKYDSSLLIPALFGIGTGLPVLFFASVTVFGARNIGVFFKRTSLVELWLRRITGTVFVLVGIYLVFHYTLRVF